MKTIDVERIYNFTEIVCSMYDVSMRTPPHPYPMISINSQNYNDIVQHLLFYAHEQIDWGDNIVEKIHLVTTGAGILLP
jgi:hypothetical protein